MSEDCWVVEGVGVFAAVGVGLGVGVLGPVAVAVGEAVGVGVGGPVAVGLPSPPHPAMKSAGRAIATKSSASLL